MPDRPNGARGISLREVLPAGQLRGAGDLRVTSCTTEWRSCRPGDLFVCLSQRPEGQREVQQALRRGAVGIVAQDDIGPLDVPHCVVPDSREALGLICQALAGFPSERLNVVGITGSYGKTTTSHLIAGVLTAGGYQPGLLGSLGCCDGLQTSALPRGGPTAPMLASWLGRSMANGCTHAVVEISGASLEQSRIAGISLDMACVTNLREDDLSASLNGRHTSMAKVFEHLLPEGVAILNADDAGTEDFLAEVDTPALTVGMDAAAEIGATVVEQTLSDQTFLLSAGRETIPVRTTLLGTHNIYNCLLAAAVGFGYGMDLATIARGLESIGSITGRLERIECGQPFGVFVDDAVAPQHLDATLETLRRLTPGRVLCVFAAPAGLEQFERTRAGRVVDRLADLAVVTQWPASKGSDNDCPGAMDDVVLGFRAGSRVRTVPERTEAIRWLLHQAREGDCVLIAGGNQESTDDREVTREFLYDNIPAHEMIRAVA